MGLNQGRSQLVLPCHVSSGDEAEKSCRGNTTFSSQIDLTVFRFSLDGDACGDKEHRRFHLESLPDPSLVYPESVSNLILRRFQSKRGRKYTQRKLTLSGFICACQGLPVTNLFVLNILISFVLVLVLILF